jgi:hypothetical protein
VTWADGLTTARPRHLVPETDPAPHLVAIVEHPGNRSDRTSVLIRVLDLVDRDQVVVHLAWANPAQW